MAINIIVRFGGVSGTSAEQDFDDKKVELMIYDKGLYVIAPNGYIDPNDTDVKFARYVKTTARYYNSKVTPQRKFHRKKKGWVTPRFFAPDGIEYPPMFSFVLEDRTEEFKYIKKTERQIFEVVFSEDNELVDPGYDIAAAFAKPIALSNSESLISFVGKKLGIRLMARSAGLPITDWLPFTVRASKGGDYSGLSRWV